MKRLVGFAVIIVVITLSAALAPQPAAARNLQQGGTWSAAIAYFNPTSSDGEFTVSYYPEPEDGVSMSTPTKLNVNSFYSGTVLVGATPGTEGSAVLSSNFPMPAVYKIAATSGDPYGVTMLEFFGSDQVGSRYFYLPVVRKAAGGLTSRIGVQNIETQPVDVLLRFVAANGTITDVTLQDIPAQTSRVFKTSDAELGTLPSGFEGSLMVNATIDGTSTAARVVAASADIETTTDTVLHSYQGSKGGLTTVSIPVVFCDYSRNGLGTRFHIQNVSAGSINLNAINIDYYNGTGAQIVSNAPVAATGTLAMGQRITVDACAFGAIQGQMLSGVIDASAEIAVVIETTSSQGLSATSISAAPHCESGSCSLALPYVEWSSSAWDFETTVYIMNTSGSGANITATYYRRDGTDEVQTFASVTPYSMVETNPTQIAGLMNMTYRDFKGAVLLESPQPMMALVLVTKRFQNPNGTLLTRGDSYMGMKY